MKFEISFNFEKWFQTDIFIGILGWDLYPLSLKSSYLKESMSLTFGLISSSGKGKGASKSISLKGSI